MKKVIKRDREFSMFRYYIRKGHNISSLLKLTATEKAFYIACFELDIEDIERSMNGKEY